MFRLLIAAPIAFVMTWGLFSFMAWMVDDGHRQPPEKTETLAFNMVMVEQEREAQRRQRAVPEKPETPEPPPEAMPKQSKASAVTPLASPTMPSVALNASVTGMAVNIPTFSDIGKDQQAMPLYRIEPKYPPRALKRGIQGYVVLSFTIDPQGRPTDIQVVDAEPKRMFDREAIRALRSWKYQPKLEGGQALAQPGQSVKLEFKLNKS
ncbi:MULTISPECIES: energy transducer TonB [unclassified Photobacterium]|uniref:energy transducer TonB n=1 Tax=unclassified Photobacterium TaxID=2628852 RepID=UPI001B8C9F41|nr:MULTISPECIES: energy transducer TonB [unclassified Photobacterium]MDO6706735.1 energy transducer TonB [Photobacterium sp. 1_MG-2023]QUJ70315.1 energy transducer TonB [Photobacterium sp. GJ3]